MRISDRKKLPTSASQTCRTLFVILNKQISLQTFFAAPFCFTNPDNPIPDSQQPHSPRTRSLLPTSA
jgi:hypothetical protein